MESNDRRIHRARLIGGLLAGALLALSLAQVGAVLGDPTATEQQIVRSVVRLLEERHLNGGPVDEEVAKEFFQNYFEELDPTKSIFLQTDIDRFADYRAKLDEQVREGDLSFAKKVFERFMLQLKERVRLVHQLVNSPHDFNVDEYVWADYEHMNWPANEAEAKERWRLRVKYELLRQKLADKPLPEPEQKEKVIRRYNSLVNRWEQTDWNDLLEIYLGALCSCYDPHTSYMSPTSVEDFTISMSLKLEGIGARLREEDGYTVVDAILPGGAAARDGRLKVGDRIVAVDPTGTGEHTQEVVNWKLTRVVRLIRGPRGTKVLLRVIPAGQTKEVDYHIARDKIELKSSEARAKTISYGKKPDSQPYRILYINLPSFYMDMGAANAGATNYKSSTRDVRRIIEEAKRSPGKLDGLVLDLRYNGGGALEEALSLTGLFIKDGPVVQVRSGRKVEAHRDPDGGELVYDGPLMVLISKLSASASEIVAGALKDYRRGLIVGDRSTHGKGTVQTMISIRRPALLFAFGSREQLGALKLTIQQFYRINGDSTQSRGVPADVVLPSLLAHLDVGEEHLKHALKFDRIQPLEYEPLGWVSDELVQEIRKRTEARQSHSVEFNKLVEDIREMDRHRKEKRISLNIDKLREEMKQRDKEKKILDPLIMPDLEKPVFERNYYNDEVLNLMIDYLQLLEGKSLAANRPGAVGGSR